MNKATIDYVQAPDFADWATAFQFDKTVFASNPGREAFFRPCSPKEMPEGQYEVFKIICGNDLPLFKLVVQIFPGVPVSVLLIPPDVKSPMDARDSISKDPEISELIRKIRLSGFGKN